ncbi:MAG TPA: SPOR domain-containing protein [Treponemataceae bacterium]|nr:SPOR domain-containing protein [Treponemataceae bacterium]
MIKKNITRAVFFLFFSLSLFAAGSETERVNALIEKSLVSGSVDQVITALVRLSVSEKLITDKKRILKALASFEERSGLFLPAAKHYNEAAWINAAKRDDSLVLDAARCALGANDMEQADALVRSVLLASFDDAILVRARVLAALIQLEIGNRRDALALISSYATNPAFIEWAPSLLFTLYWSENNVSARDSILSSWPQTPEAGIIRGEISLAALPFWFLMDRNEQSISSFNKTLTPLPSSSSPAVPIVTTQVEVPQTQTEVPSNQPKTSKTSESLWQQVGFFKNKEYAEELAGKLTSLGFKPLIRSEVRPSGTLYFAVLVPEDTSYSTAAHLKDAGFESYLVFE